MHTYDEMRTVYNWLAYKFYTVIYTIHLRHLFSNCFPKNMNYNLSCSEFPLWLSGNEPNWYP